jgi:predicted AAA+ superfamily ATPase
MAMTNHERVGKAMELLRAGLAPFVDREFKAAFRAQASEHLMGYLRDDPMADKSISDLDASLLLKLMWASWNDVFRKVLGHVERSLVSELRDVRNKWAHQEAFSSDDAYRALDSADRLLTAVSAPEAQELEKLKMELLRVRFDEQVRGEKRKSAGSAVESQATGSLKPWREVVTPHKDVASGRYQQAEFAADLWQVHLGEGGDEYRNPVEFFRRTFLTDSLRRLLVGAVERLSGNGGDPVVQLQTNFGGGKTHSMLALYHLFSGTLPAELAGIEEVIEAAGVSDLPTVRRVVLVGNKISPGNPVKKSDGTVIHTLWGELAWQLGFAAGGKKLAKEAFSRIAEDDKNATNPGDALRELFVTYGPCLVLIDEWVAYARQLHDAVDLPGGNFDTQFTFAQALTECAKGAKNCLVVISLPASDSPTSPHAQADDAEVGGQRGREALERLRNVIGRVESSWRPASAEEGFEIVRRRLFEPLVDPSHFKDRDVVARAFADLYRTQQQEFPPECREASYEQRMKAAYPIHPEVFDRLYTDWSTLAKFQRTRGVLRLMAAVIHSLWEKGDRNPLIQPANLPVDDSRVQFELTRYLSDNWVPVIEKDVDGPSSLPLQMDAALPNLGKFSACRRVARTIYLGSAPTQTAAHRGVEDQRIKLGCVIPGESPAVFGDALRRLAAEATYLYQEGPRYWYSTQPTVTNLAENRAEQLLRDPDRVVRELDARLRADLRKPGDFLRIHALPQSGQDVPDDLDARLVVLGIDAPFGKDPQSPAETAAREILDKRGNSPRLHQNTLIFLAADRTRLQDLDAAVRKLLAWESILADRESLNLDPHQAKQAEAQRVAADARVTAQLPETYQWLLVPEQKSPNDPIRWEAIRLSGQDPLAVRASKRLRRDELLITSFGANNLRMILDRIPLWRGDHVGIKQLVEDFARYVYLPRLAEARVLAQAMRDGVTLLTWMNDSFAYAESYDEEAKRYRGLRAGQAVYIDADMPGLLVNPDVAKAQLDAEIPAPTAKAVSDPRPASQPGEASGATEKPDNVTEIPAQRRPHRFHGSVELDQTRVGRDAGRIAEELISHLAGLPGVDVRVTLEIEADIPEGVPESIVRTVTENARTLKFRAQGFEEE